MSLTDRIRPNIEAAPWVIVEIRKREEVTAALIDELTRIKAENAKLREALERIATTMPPTLTLLSRSRKPRSNNPERNGTQLNEQHRGN